ITPIYVIVFTLLTIALIKNWASFPTSAAIPVDRFQLTPFMMILSIIAAYYVSYGPYVADYSRYLPASTSTAQAFWYTYAGTLTSALWVMILGAAIQSTFAQANAIVATANVASSMGRWLQILTLLVLILGLINIQAFNIYGAMMSTLTIVTTL